MMMMMMINQKQAWQTGTAKYVLHLHICEKLHRGNCSFLAFGCFLPHACVQAVAIELDKACERARRHASMCSRS